MNDTKSFLKDWERLSRSGRYEMNRLKQAVNVMRVRPLLLEHHCGQAESEAA